MLKYLAVAVTSVFIVPNVCPGQDVVFEKIGAEYEARILPVMDRYCLSCHDAETKKGELDLERFAGLTDIRADPEVWQKIVEQLEYNEMPPKDKKQLPADEKSMMLSWIAEYLEAEAHANAGDPGPVVLRRLSNIEFTHTVRDLTGLEGLDPVREFPVDSAAGEGFTNSGEALVMSPALLDKYLAAGKEIASHAVLLPDGFRFSEFVSRRDQSNEILSEIRSVYAQDLNSKGVDFSYRSEVGNANPSDTGEGRVNLAVYFEKLIAQRKGVLETGRGDEINDTYLEAIARMLEAKGGDSFLLDELRRRMNAANPGDGAAVAAWVRGWQDALWKFNTVGNLLPGKSWQEPVTPMVDQVSLPLNLVEGKNLTLLASGSDANEALWEKPRIVRPGKSPILLRDVRGMSVAFERYRQELFAHFDALMEAAFSGKGEGVDASHLALMLRYLKSSSEPLEYLHGKVKNTVQGWKLSGVDDLSIMANASDATLRIPGEVPPHKIVVHPRPERWIAAGWVSPVDGTVTVNAQVIDRHDNCGNGVTWSIRHGAKVLESGAIDNGGVAEVRGVEKLAVKKGDMISLEIGARDGSHVCDLTEIDLRIVSKGKEWSLSGDCADTILAGNPHADRHGNLEVWHFITGLNESSGSAVADREDELIRNWRECDTADEAARLGKEIKDYVMENRSSKLFSSLDFATVASRALPSELNDVRDGLDPSMFDADGNLRVKTPSALSFSLPRELMQDAQFAVTGKALKGVLQMQLVSGRAEAPSFAAPSVPFVVGGDKATLAAGLDKFRDLFPAAMCYVRVVPVDSVVTLVLYHREDHYFSKHMLRGSTKRDLDKLWDELRYVSQDAFQAETGLEQILEFATQDGDPRTLIPFKEPIAQAAENLKKRLVDSEPVHLKQLTEFAGSAWRRPLEEKEKLGLHDLYQRLRDDELTHEEAFRLVLAKIFASPGFLYKQETPPPGAEPGPVSDWELAARLSYFLWSSVPDYELQMDAEAGTLKENLTHHTERMRKSPKIRRMASAFGAQWLGVRDFDQNVEKSESEFPEFTELREAMNEEPIQFFGDMFHRNQSIMSILRSDHTFVNQKLAEFYNFSDTQSEDEWQMIGIRQQGRGGVLGMASVLASQSGVTNTSPILRGNWVAETLLGEKLPKPPKGVPPLPETLPAGLTQRELIEQHSSDPACAKCHVRIDPYGFALEQFDAIGRMRNEPVNTKTNLTDGTSLEGLAGLQNYLYLERSDDFARQFCRKLLGYALGRATRLSDEPLLDDMVSALKREKYTFGAAVDCIVGSRQFREIRGRDYNEKN
jgi:hypothetical protein